MRVGGRAQKLRFLGCVAVVGIASFAHAPSAQAGHAAPFRRVEVAGRTDAGTAVHRREEIDASPFRVIGGGRTAVMAAVPPQIVKILRRQVCPRGGKGASGEPLADPHARPMCFAFSRSAQAVLVANAAHLPRLCRWLL